MPKFEFSQPGLQQRGALYNKNDLKIEYDATVLKWCIANVNKEPLRSGFAYNIVISSNGGLNTPKPSLTPSLTPTTKTPTATQPPTTTPMTPCTKETAYQTVGKWKRQGKDDLAMADSSFPKEHYKPVLAKAQKVISLLMLANPEFKGIQALADRNIRSYSASPGGALSFGMTAGYFEYYCVPDTPSYPEIRGQVKLGAETDTWIGVYFNSFGNLLGRASNEEMRYFPKSVGQIAGLDLFQLTEDGDREQQQIIIIAPKGHRPYKPVTREQFLRSRLKYYQAQTGNFNAKEIAYINASLASMSPAELQTQAIVRSIEDLAGKNMFVTEFDGGKRLVTSDKDFFDQKLPRETIQFIVISLRWNDKDPAKLETIRQFKQKFDFEALRQMLGK